MLNFKAKAAFSLAASLIFALVLLSSTSCTRKPKSQKEKVSYTIGAQFGKSLKTQNLDIDGKALSQGIMDGLKNESLKLTDEEMQSAMMSLNEDRQKELQAEAEKNKTASDGFLTKNKSAEGVQVTASGLQYKIIAPGAGPSPKIDDIVVVHYKGTLIDGKEFDSSYARKIPAEFPIKGVIPGWTEGLQLMKKGGKAVFYVPPELGYGDRPRNNIPASSTLIFEVELLDVKSGAKSSGSAHPKK